MNEYPRQSKEDIEKMMAFYQVDTLEGLVDAQAYHVERLQEKLPKLRDTEPRQIRA